MPRKARLSPPACFFHLMASGIEGQQIFRSDGDRKKFLDLLSAALRRTGYACYGWSLMGSHYHLVVRSSEQHLSKLMRGLNAGYAQYFSKTYHRRGYVFQDRYKSLVTQDQGYVEELIRYVHTNPLRAGVCRSVEELSTYPWTGHAVLMGNRTAEFQDTWPVLHKFGSTVASGRKGYLAFIAQAGRSEDELPVYSLIRKGNTDRDRRTPGAYVIGDPEFVKRVLAKDHARRAEISRFRLEGLSIEDVASKIAAAGRIAPKDLLRRGRANRRAAMRKIFAYACHCLYGYPIVDIARYLGCAHSPMSLAVRQGEELAKEKQYANILMALRP